MTAVQPSAPTTVTGLLGLLGDAEFRDDGNVITVEVPPSRLEAAVHHLAACGARLADLFAADGDRVTLRLVWALDTERQYLITESPVAGGEYPALSDIAPAAFYEECEIYEQFGIRPATGKPLNRVALPPHAGPDFPRLGRQPRQAPAEIHAPHTVGGHAFEFPFGPVRQAGMESLYYGLVTSGEEVVDLYLFTWHKHRGLEWRLRGQTPREGLFHVERTEGLSAIAMSWAYAAAVEAALDVVPPVAAQRTRAVALELERLYNHAAATAGLCQATGLTVGQSAAEIALERLLRLNAAVFGHRYLFGVMDAGGVRRAPDEAALRAGLPGAHGELRRAADALMSTNSFLDLLDAGAGTGTTTLPTAAGSGLGWAESSRGEALAWVALDAEGRITRARLRPASVRNWRGFDDACRSQNVFTDIPIIEASFWLTVAGTAR